jgi:uncharacterized protein with FMN-binding domain
MTRNYSRLGAAGIAASLALGGSAFSPFALAQPGQVSRTGTLILAAADTAVYADGTYTATGQYGGGPSFVTVTASLARGLVTAVEVKPHATNPTSLALQRRFAAAAPAAVVGKPIKDLKLGRLAGSSNTPKGFNAAIEQIREQAARAGKEST